MLRVNLSTFPCRDARLVDIEVIWRPRCGCTILLVAVLPHLTPGEIVWASKKAVTFFNWNLYSRLFSPHKHGRYTYQCTSLGLFPRSTGWCVAPLATSLLISISGVTSTTWILSISNRHHPCDETQISTDLSKMQLKHLVYFSKSSFRAPSLAWHWKMDDFLKKNTMNLHLWVLDHRHFHWGRQIGETKHLPECIQISSVNATIGSPGLSI